MYAVVVIPLGGGAPLATFDADLGDGDTRQKATVERVTWVLNQPGSASFTAPLRHPATAEVVVLGCEVEIYRDDTLIWRGIPVQRERSGPVASFTCAGLLWPFTKWHIGPNVNDYLDGALTFEAGLTGWTAVGCAAAITTSLIREGTKAALLTSAAAGADNYLEWSFVVPTTGGVGVYLEVTAEYHIDTSTPWVGPALDERGLYVQSANAVPDSNEWEPITNSSPKGTWTRVTTGIQLPPNLANQVVTVRCYSPGGRIAWDNGTVKAEDSISAQPAGTDAATLLGQVFDYCTLTKTNLGLTRATPATGALIADVYRMDELPNVFETFESFPARSLLDYAVVDRVFTSFAPRRGSYKPGRALTITPETVPPVTTALSYEHRVDGSTTATRVIRTGAGSGATRDVHQAQDTALTGLVLESVGSVPAIYGPNGMRDMAAVDLAQLRDVVTTPSARVPADGWLGVLLEGDTTDVLIADGAVQEATIRRVLEVDLDPGTDTVSYGLADEAGVP